MTLLFPSLMFTTAPVIEALMPSTRTGTIVAGCSMNEELVLVFDPLFKSSSDFSKSSSNSSQIVNTNK